MNAFLDQNNPEMMENYEQYTDGVNLLRTHAESGEDLNDNKKNKAGFLLSALNMYINKLEQTQSWEFLKDADDTIKVIDDMEAYYHNLVKLCNM
jgi:hypothetical protein